MIRKFLTWMNRILITIVLASFIFSYVSFDFQNTLHGLFSDAFAYANLDAQKNVIEVMVNNCNSLKTGNEIISLGQICQNQSLLDSIRRNCNDYYKLKKEGISFDDENNIINTCEQIKQGNIEQKCNSGEKMSTAPDLSKFSKSCQDYENKKTSNEEFFAGFISSVAGSQELPKIDVIEKYSAIMGYLSSNKVIYIVILLTLAVILYFLTPDHGVFFIELAETFFSVGVIIMLPFFLIGLYRNFVGFYTTPILNSLFGNGNGLEPKSIISLVLLLFSRMYSNTLIVLGIISLVIGISGKVYKISRRGNSKFH